MQPNMMAQRVLPIVKSHRYSLRTKLIEEPSVSNYPGHGHSGSESIPYSSNNIPKKIPTERQPYTNKTKADK